jgi:CheY-like chemotaxis protein
MKTKEARPNNRIHLQKDGGIPRFVVSWRPPFAQARIASASMSASKQKNGRETIGRWYWRYLGITRLCHDRAKAIPKYNGRPSLNAHYFVMKSLGDRSGSERPLLSVVDDDESMRESLPDLIKEFGFVARAFSSAEEFLSSGSVDETSCLILDIAMPGMTGPELYQELKRRGEKIPTIFITAQKDETIRARVLEQGAAGFLLKPFTDAALLAAIKTALQAI